MVRRRSVVIYTDGACSGNPGAGGFAVVIVDPVTNTVVETISRGYRLTTNNRMELAAMVVALQKARHYSDVVIYTDSEYVAKAISEGWLKKWQASGWRKADKKPVANKDLWQRVLVLLTDVPAVRVAWVKGHAGNKFNELANQLAVNAVKNPGYDDPGMSSQPTLFYRRGLIVILNMRGLKQRPTDGVCFRVDRGTALGNPFVIGRDGDRDQVCDKYEAWIQQRIKDPRTPQHDYILQIYRAARAGEKVYLLCWCAPARCHAETIKRLIEEALSR